MPDKTPSPVIISSDPVRIDVHLETSTRGGLDLLRRVQTFAAEMRNVGLVVEIEGTLAVRISSPTHATTPQEATS